MSRKSSELNTGSLVLMGLMCLALVFEIWGNIRVSDNTAFHRTSICHVAVMLSLAIAIAIQLTEIQHVVALKKRAGTDVTGVSNKWAFQERMNLLNRKSTSLGLGFISFDLNNLKQVNDQLGHEAGDRLIGDFARLLSCADWNSFIARVGGDEFVMIQENADQESLQRTLEILNAMVEDYNRYHSPKLSFAYGCDLCTVECYRLPEELLRNSDLNMYRKKNEMKQAGGVSYGQENGYHGTR